MRLLPDKFLRVFSGADGPKPDVNGRYHDHRCWNRFNRYWQDDLRLIKEAGITTMRCGLPWSDVQVGPCKFNWGELDRLMEEMVRLGLSVWYPVAHFNYPKWIGEKWGVHPVYAPDLADHLAYYVGQLIQRYHLTHLTIMVEVGDDWRHRFLFGDWAPHQTSGCQAVKENLFSAYRAGAEVARQRGATVIGSEPIDALSILGDLPECWDVIGLDYYPHVHTLWDPLATALAWHRSWPEKPLLFSEFGTVESRNKAGRKFPPGHCDKRLQVAREQHRLLRSLQQEGITIAGAGWYPGPDNLWDTALTSRPRHYGDRGGLIDFQRQDWRRVPCSALMQEVASYADLFISTIG